eukprot:1124591-Prymnesium_polylepis.1
MAQVGVGGGEDERWRCAGVRFGARHGFQSRLERLDGLPHLDELVALLARRAVWRAERARSVWLALIETRLALPLRKLGRLVGELAAGEVNYRALRRRDVANKLQVVLRHCDHLRAQHQRDCAARLCPHPKRAQHVPQRVPNATVVRRVAAPWRAKLWRLVAGLCAALVALQDRLVECVARHKREHDL